MLLLRFAHKNEEADFLETGKLTAAIATAREVHAATDGELQAAFLREEERVDDAHALAEILLPLLTASLVATPLMRTENSSFPRSDAPSGFNPASAPTSPVESQPPSPLLPGIADFIDEMLTQDRAPRDRGSRHTA